MLGLFWSGAELTPGYPTHLLSPAKKRPLYSEKKNFSEITASVLFLAICSIFIGQYHNCVHVSKIAEITGPYRALTSLTTGLGYFQSVVERSGLSKAIRAMIVFIRVFGLLL